MGNLIWHEYARITTVTASIYAIWASYWGLFYRKFFWDFVAGTLRDPGGLQDIIFVRLIVKAPIIQTFAMVLAMFILALDFPLPQLKSLSIHRSIVLRMVLLFFQIFLTILFYQGTNAAIWSFIAMICYTRAQILGERMYDPKPNQGGGNA